MIVTRSVYFALFFRALAYQFFEEKVKDFMVLFKSSSVSSAVQTVHNSLWVRVMWENYRKAIPISGVISPICGSKWDSEKKSYAQAVKSYAQVLHRQAKLCTGNVKILTQVSQVLQCYENWG